MTVTSISVSMCSSGLSLALSKSRTGSSRRHSDCCDPHIDATRRVIAVGWLSTDTVERSRQSMHRHLLRATASFRYSGPDPSPPLASRTHSSISSHPSTVYAKYATGATEQLCIGCRAKSVLVGDIRNPRINNVRHRHVTAAMLHPTIEAWVPATQPIVWRMPFWTRRMHLEAETNKGKAYAALHDSPLLSRPQRGRQLR